MGGSSLRIGEIQWSRRFITAPPFVLELQVRCLPAAYRLGPFVTYLRGDGHEHRPDDLGDGLEGGRRAVAVSCAAGSRNAAV